MSKISKVFSKLKQQNKKAFISYICAGDPDYETSLEILKKLPQNGCDIIEVGVPFLDPAGDGPTIEDASKRAIANGMTLAKTLQMIKEFREENKNTPIVVMTYFNPLLKYGLDKVFLDMKEAGTDAALIVDLPFEEEKEAANFIKEAKIDFIKLITPTTTLERAKKILKNAKGFIYLVSMLGITGTKSAKITDNEDNLRNLRTISKLPIAIGFGIKTPEVAQNFCKMDLDAIVVGSTLVKEIKNNNCLTKAKEFSEVIHDNKKY